MKHAAAVRQLSNGTNGDDLCLLVAMVGNSIQTGHSPYEYMGTLGSTAKLGTVLKNIQANRTYNALVSILLRQRIIPLYQPTMVLHLTKVVKDYFPRLFLFAAVVEVSIYSFETARGKCLIDIPIGPYLILIIHWLFIRIFSLRSQRFCTCRRRTATISPQEVHVTEKSCGLTMNNDSAPGIRILSWFCW